MRMDVRRSLPVLLLFAWAPSQAVASDREPAAAQHPDDAVVMRSVHFQDAHPDQRFRALGIEAQRNGRSAQARRYFRTAARYGDKLSQAALAEMHWSGQGGARDRALGYVWMDLAAERGTPWLLQLRERYWREMNDAERARAVREGGALAAEFADAVAKPRLEAEMRRVRNTVTGSRLGWVSSGLDLHETASLKDIDAGRSAPPVDSDTYFADRYWQPDAYWRWQDQVLRAAPRRQEVEVGTPQNLPGNERERDATGP